MNQNTLSQDQPRQQTRREVVTSIKAKADAKKTWTDHLADRATAFFSSVHFLVLNVVVFVAWVIFNSGLVPGLPQFDPFPFVALTTIVSLEAIILSVFVLISQNRASKVADLREETDLQLNLIEEQEITKILNLLCMLLEKNGIDISKDTELRAMTERTDAEQIQALLEKQLE